MATMNITVVNVETEVKPTAKGSYDVYEVTYKDQDGKTASKKIFSFVVKVGASLLKNAVKGTKLTVTMEKNDKGYWDWIAVNAEGDASAPVVSSSSPSPSSSGGKAGYTTNTNRDWETKEERQARQVMIVRQSSISNAIALLKTDKVIPTPTEITQCAAFFESFVMGQINGTAADQPVVGVQVPPAKKEPPKKAVLAPEVLEAAEEIEF